MNTVPASSEVSIEGLCLNSFADVLSKVPEHQSHKPLSAIPYMRKRIADWKHLDSERRMCEISRTFSFDELCRAHYSDPFIMGKPVRKLFETAPYELVRKIGSSMFVWGSDWGTWNEVVDAYENIRNFSFVDDADFEIRLDHTTFSNEFGYTKYSGLFIDGVFAFLVYYKRKHVMTVGFSIVGGKRLLLQQIQSARRSGNRYLYRLPQNRLEFLIELFQRNFSGYQLYVIDGNSLVEKTLGDFRKGLSLVRNYASREENDDHVDLEAAITHLEAEGDRLGSFYRDSGRFTLGPGQTIKGLMHYSVQL